MQIIDLRGKLPTHKSKKYKTRKESDVRSIGIHHSLTVSGTPQAFATYHVNTNGWPGIAYPYVIQRDGTIYKCHNHNVVTYQVGNSNKHSLGMVTLGRSNQRLSNIQQPYGLCKNFKKSCQTLKRLKGIRNIQAIAGKLAL